MVVQNFVHSGISPDVSGGNEDEVEHEVKPAIDKE